MLDAEIKKLIESNLPEQVGAVLKERLKQAERLQSDLAAEKDAHGLTKEKLDTANANLGKHKSLDVRAEEAAKREAAIQARESEASKRESAIALTEYKAQAANEKCDAIFRLTEIVCGKRPARIHTESTSETVPAPISPGMGYGGTLQTGRQTTIEEREQH